MSEFLLTHVPTARKVVSPQALEEQLLQNGFSASGETTKFAQELFARVPHKDTNPNVCIKRVHG